MDVECYDTEAFLKLVGLELDRIRVQVVDESGGWLAWTAFRAELKTLADLEELGIAVRQQLVSWPTSATTTNTSATYSYWDTGLDCYNTSMKMMTDYTGGAHRQVYLIDQWTWGPVSLLDHYRIVEARLALEYLELDE